MIESKMKGNGNQQRSPKTLCRIQNQTSLKTLNDSPQIEPQKTCDKTFI